MNKDGPDNQLPLPLFAKEAKRVGELQKKSLVKESLTFSCGANYVSEMQNGLPNGTGALSFKGSSHHYSGELVDGLPQGKGTLDLGDGNRLTGEFTGVDWDLSYGTINYAHGAEYRGEIHDYGPHGYGTWTSTNGYKLSLIHI